MSSALTLQTTVLVACMGCILATAALALPKLPDGRFTQPKLKPRPDAEHDHAVKLLFPGFPSSARHAVGSPDPCFEQRSSFSSYPLSNYTFGVKDPLHEEDPSVSARLQRLQNQYEDFGMRRSVEGIMLVHEHGHPHILMIQIANAFFKLPGDYLKPGEEYTTGLQKRMDQWLEPTGELMEYSESQGLNGDFEVGDCLAQWWRPNFEQFMYPYCPAHVTQPKETKLFYHVQLPEKKVLSVPKNMKLMAIPIFELYDNSTRYGPQLSSIPQWLSRFQFIYA